MAFVQFSGVTLHEPDLTYDSYVLYTGADGITRLIDLDGAVRREWPYPGVPARIIDPALNGGRLGDIGVQLSQLDDSPGGIYANRTVGQLSWAGETLWEWGSEAPGGAARQNHDWELLANGNRLILVAIPREVPDTIVSWFEGGAADGFNIMAPALPSGLATFVEQVVPILRSKGLFREEYRGTTLREHYGLITPVNQFHPAPG